MKKKKPRKFKRPSHRNATAGSAPTAAARPRTRIARSAPPDWKTIAAAVAGGAGSAALGGLVVNQQILSPEAVGIGLILGGGATAYFSEGTPRVVGTSIAAAGAGQEAIRSKQLVAPAINVAIGCDLLRLIVASYRKHHPQIPSLQADWNNPRFVELLTFGWNAGYSEAGGLGRVARYLEQLGASDIDVDLIAAHAKLAGATKHLSNPAKLAWRKGVAALYQRERALARAAFVSS